LVLKVSVRWNVGYALVVAVVRKTVSSLGLLLVHLDHLLLTIGFLAFHNIYRVDVVLSNLQLATLEVGIGRQEVNAFTLLVPSCPRQLVSTVLELLSRLVVRHGGTGAVVVVRIAIVGDALVGLLHVFLIEFKQVGVHLDFCLFKVSE
jgi:hypothetical protein